VSLFRVALTSDIPLNQTRYYCVDRRPILIANYRGEFFALDGICPHRHNPLDGAQLWDHLVDCPWHHFQYDVRTGENWYPRNVYPADMPHLENQVQPLATFRVELRGPEIWVELA
jgi:nitrite reductase/ring-hydroxylating ferredoxin subunit